MEATAAEPRTHWAAPILFTSPRLGAHRMNFLLDLIFTALSDALSALLSTIFSLLLGLPG